MVTKVGGDGVLSSLERVFDVIEYLDAMTRETSIQQISQNLNINKATVFRILKTMCVRGYAYQNPDNKKYSLSLAFYHIGFRTKNKMPMAQVLSPYVPQMEKLRDKYDESINVSMLDHHYKKRLRLTNIMTLKSQYMLQRVERDIGSTDAHTSASGKCLMAYAPKGFIDQFRDAPLMKATPFSIGSWEEMDAEMERIRKNGYSECLDEHEIGISCVAVPIVSDVDASAHAALSLSGQTNRIQRKKSAEMVADLKSLAAEMAKSF